MRALYLHIPFCRSICPFCAFAVHGDKAGLHGAYLSAMEKEIALSAAAFQSTDTHDSPSAGENGVESIYFGGGTPSTLSLPEVSRLLNAVRNAFTVQDGVEIAFEINPEDATREYMAGLASLGVNRFSLGLQSFQDGTLRSLGRSHTGDQCAKALEALEALQAMQGTVTPNYNIDLLYGAPGVELDSFHGDVEMASSSSALHRSAPHISLYGLDIEPGTLFARSPATVKWNREHQEQQAEAYLWASAYLRKKGYRHYEVSNFCLPGRSGRQNEIVWDGEEYLGFGPGAHSFSAGERWHNRRHLRGYLRHLEEGSLPVAYRERPTLDQRANEELMLSLRRDTGLEISQWEKKYGHPWGNRRAAVVRRLQEDGKAAVGSGSLALTPAGFLVADEITALLAESV